MRLWKWAVLPPLCVLLVAGAAALLSRPVQEHQIASTPHERFVVEAMQAAERGDNALAIEKFSAAIELQPNDHHAIWRRAMTHMNLQQYDRALEDLDRALKLAMHPYYLQSRGQILFMVKRYDEAIADLKEASAMDPTNAIAWQLQADALATQGKYVEAIEPYTKALEACQPTAVLYQARGNAAANAGQPDRAIVDYTKALEIEPRNLVLFQTRANALTAAGRLEEALADYESAIELDPTNEVSRQARVVALQRLGRDETAAGPRAARR